MSTIRQQKLAKAIVVNVTANEPLNKQELVASVGYSPASADKKATEILESKGTQYELKRLGFSEEGAKAVVEEILYDKYADQNVRLNAAKEVFKVFGTYAVEKTFNLNVNASAEELNSLIKKDLERFRANK